MKKEIYKDTETENLTKSLEGCSIRVIEDGQAYDYKIDASKGFVLKADNSNRSQHPYIASFLSGIRKDFTEQILVLNEDGTERIGPINIPAGKIPVFRIRNRIGGKNGTEKFIIIGIVDKSSQVLHSLNIYGTVTEVTSPPEHGPNKKIELMPEELSRL